MMEYKTSTAFAFPQASNSEYTCDAPFSKGHLKKCSDQQNDDDLMKKDTGTSNYLPGKESLVFRAGSDPKLGLNFSRSRLETACETELGLSRGSLEKIEVVDLTRGMGLEDEKLKRVFSQNEEIHPRTPDFLKNNSEENKRKRKKSLLLQEMEENPTRKKSENFKLSEDDRYKPRGGSYFGQSEEFYAVSDGDTGNNASLGKRPFKDPVDIASQNGGKMLKMKKTKAGVKVSFTCKMNHRFSLMGHEMEKWCKVCKKLLNNAKNHAHLNRGKLLNEDLQRELTFQCENGHKWKVSYKKCLRNWCKICKKNRKKLVKEILAEENKKIEAERKDKQEKMLNEARIKMLSENKKCKKELDMHIETFQILEEEISKVAKKYANEFLQKSPESEFEQIMELYKVLILPEKSIRLYFEALSRKKLKKQFRRYTILLHPDKNCHPKAKTAFQKIFEIFQNALKKMDKETKFF